MEYIKVKRKVFEWIKITVKIYDNKYGYKVNDDYLASSIHLPSSDKKEKSSYLSWQLLGMTISWSHCSKLYCTVSYLL